MGFFWASWGLSCCTPYKRLPGVFFRVVPQKGEGTLGLTPPWRRVRAGAFTCWHFELARTRRDKFHSTEQMDSVRKAQLAGPGSTGHQQALRSVGTGGMGRVADADSVCGAASTQLTSHCFLAI